MNATFPHPAPVVVRDHELRVTRTFPAGSEIRTRAGERVAADTVIGRVDPRQVAVRVPIADQLDLNPADVAKHLMRPVGSTLAAGEPLARVRRGMRTAVAAAPVGGILLEVDTESGNVLLAPAGAGDLRALVPGDVERVDGKTAVVIRSVGSRVLGIVGLGNPAAGTLRIAVERPDQELTAAAVTPAMAGTIVVGGAWAGAAALKKLAEVGAAGLVVGGFVEKELATYLGWSSEDRLAPWRLGAGGRPIADGAPVTFAMVATEGFGPAPMNGDAFALLAGLAGRQAVLLTATRADEPLTRPEILVPDTDALDEDAAASTVALSGGSRVRVVDQTSLGRTGAVVGEPRRERLHDGVWLELVDVEFDRGGRRTVRVANVEVVA